MKSQNKYPGIDKLIVTQVRYHAWRLKRLGCFAREDVEDIEQELMCEILSSMNSYNIEKAKLSTFLDRILRSRSVNMIRNRRRVTKDEAEKIMLTESDEELEDYINSKMLGNSFDKVDLAIDAKKIIAKLPRKHREIAVLLQDLSSTEIAQIKSMPRSSIYNLIKKIREYFADLSIYLKKI